MVRIKKQLEIRGSKKSETLEVLFDSGAEDSFICGDIAKNICDITPTRTTEFTPGDGKTDITAKGACTVITEIKICEIKFSPWFVENLTQKVVIGADALQKYNLKLDFEQDDIDVSKCRRKFELFQATRK